jgi:hypothetical protein
MIRRDDMLVELVSDIFVLNARASFRTEVRLKEMQQICLRHQDVPSRKLVEEVPDCWRNALTLGADPSLTLGAPCIRQKSGTLHFF